MPDDLAAVSARVTKLVERMDGILERYDGRDHTLDPSDVDSLLIHVRRLLELSAQECMATLMDLALSPEHDGCPCRKTGQHRIHRCEHGTEWWPAAEAEVRTRGGYEHRDANGMIVSCGDIQQAVQALPGMLVDVDAELTQLRTRVNNAVSWLEDYVDDSDGISGTEVAYDAVKILRGES